MELYKRIKKRREELGISQDELAQKLGYKSRSTIAKIEKGENDITQSKIAAFAQALQTTPGELMGFGNPDDSSLPEGTFRPILKRVPMLGYAAAGEPLENLDGQDTYFVETDSKYHVDFCITVRGESMINAGINDGDIVFVRKQPEVENGQIACVEIERNCVCIKRFYKTNRGVMLVSENPKYAPLQFNEENCNDFRILGLAVIKQSEIH